ncbi:condensation domain-containing protein [Streptomyces cocklensis]|uniref:Condensation domain-containing protein n=1 Tax=Actinacidiphila cocklensis TaxID=887465 RepID=A0A9W4GP18_9ACTN|nr:condensation domain-containing protein [Actinacidiphila cocklensis]MDD1062486.1 condensation domain-containing protein [Actinacidiphila cocklensis]CAG6391980.1 Condensation domain-containing protein [Actinacidiphila cocklensis]
MDPTAVERTAGERDADDRGVVPPAAAGGTAADRDAGEHAADPPATAADTRTVAFGGGRSRSGPLTFGQSNVLRWIRKPADRGSATVPAFFDIPAGTSLTAVTEALATLIARHESLRTTYVDPPGGEPAQTVAAAGTLRVSSHEFGSSGRDPRSVLERLLAGGEGDLVRELPVRAAVATRAGEPFLLVLVISHMAVDVGSVRLLGEQFAALLADPASVPPGPEPLQPLDLAAAESTPAGRRRAQAALRYWEATLAAAPQAMFAVPPDPSPPGRRRRTTFRSRAAALAISHVVARTGIGPSTVVLAAFAVCTALRTGNDRCVVTSVAGNRIRGATRGYVGNLAQDALLSVDVRAEHFDAVVKRAGTAAFNAYRYSQFDADELWRVIDGVGRARGTAFHRDVVYNDFSALDTAAAAVSAPPPVSLAEVHEALAETRLTSLPDESYPVAAYLSVRQVVGELVLALWADSAVLPRRDVEGLLRGVERLLVAAAAEDLKLADAPAATGLSAPQRGRQWMRIDGCWVERAATAEVLAAAAAAAGAGPVAVVGSPAAEPGDTEQGGPAQGGTDPLLTGYAAWTGDPQAAPAPEDLHEAFLAELTGRYAAMAPASYVVCAGEPDDPGDEASWRKLPVLARGTGRGAEPAAPAD